MGSETDKGGQQEDEGGGFMVQRVTGRGVVSMKQGVFLCPDNKMSGCYIKTLLDVLLLVFFLL